MAKGIQILTDEILETVKGGLPKAPTSPPTPQSLAEKAPPLMDGPSFGGSLEEAANLLLSILPGSVRDYANELADITLKIPRWQLILGSLMAQQEGGSLAAPSIDPSWRQIELLLKDSICEYKPCGKKFKPKKAGQLFCTNDCGDLARGEEIKKQNKLREQMRKAESEARKEAGLNP